MQRKAHAAGLPEPTVAERRAVLDGAAERLLADPSIEGVGNLLYAVVALASELGVDAEEALRGAALDERDRIVAVERAAPGREAP
jgi:uncharacterized protein YabN with tetrapyrrole methylase and pyrophosphatase domain